MIDPDACVYPMVGPGKSYAQMITGDWIPLAQGSCARGGRSVGNVLMRRIISMLLQNEAGALARVANLFSARGYNIDSLTVAATHDPAVSRLTMVTAGEDVVIDQIVKQTRKLVDVIEIADLTSREHLECELLMVKVAATPAKAQHVAACVRRHPRAVFFDEGDSTRTIQITGSAAPNSTRSWSNSARRRASSRWRAAARRRWIAASACFAKWRERSQCDGR